MGNRAALIESKKGAVVVRDAETQKPGAGEVLIRVSSAARIHVIPGADIYRWKCAASSLQM